MISLTMYNHESSRLIELHLENVPVSSKASCEKTQSDCCDRQCFFRWRIKPILSRKAVRRWESVHPVTNPWKTSVTKRRKHNTSNWQQRWVPVFSPALPHKRRWPKFQEDKTYRRSSLLCITDDRAKTLLLDQLFLSLSCPFPGYLSTHLLTGKLTNCLTDELTNSRSDYLTTWLTD